MQYSIIVMKAVLVIGSAVAAWVGSPGGTAAATTVVNDFSDPGQISAWSFAVKSAGATGQMTAGPGYQGGGGAVVTFDLGCDVVPGSCYVRVSRKFASPAPGKLLDTWIRCTACDDRFEVVDSTGQVLVYNAVPLPISAKSLSSWHRVILSLPDHINQHWGGANDGIFHEGIKEIRLVVRKDDLLGRNGVLQFDELRLHDTISDAVAPEITLDAPISAYEPPSQISPLTNIMQGVNNYDGVLTGSKGFSYIRSNIMWSKVEAQVGTYNFKFYDKILQDIKSFGGGALFTLGYGHPVHTGNRPPRSEAEIAAFARFVAATAAHYKGQPVDLELWNEPNWPNFWSPTPSAAEFGKLLSQAIPAARSVNPSVKIVTGGLVQLNPGSPLDPWPFLRDLIRSNAISGATALGIHPYPEKKIGDPENRWRDLLRGQLMIAQEMGSRALPLRITEWGLASPGMDANGDGHSSQSRHAQAVKVARSYLTWIVVGPIDYSYFLLVDKCDDARDPECNLGLMTFSRQEKPAMKSLQTLSAAVTSRTYGGILRQSSTLPPWLNVARFDGTSDTIFAIWLSAPNMSPPLRIPENGTAINMYGVAIAGGGAAVPLIYANGPIYVRVPKAV